MTKCARTMANPPTAIYPAYGGWSCCPPRWMSVVQHRWLTSVESLTARLRQLTGSFLVEDVVVCRKRLCMATDGPLGHGASGAALVRTVTLTVNRLPVVVAHSVVPLARQFQWPLHRLGVRPLAELLFFDPQVQRFPLQYKRLHAHHPLTTQAQRRLPRISPEMLLARRSQFYRQGAPLLLSEVFLPTLWEHPDVR